jgi:O-antigen/teichoic acid export membrane protein
MNFDRAEMKQLLRKSAPMGMVIVMLALRGNVGSLLTKWMAGPEATGFFALPQRVCSIAVLAGSAVIAALYPRICSAGAGSAEDTRRAVNTLSSLTILVYCAVGLALALPSTGIITLLFGKKFAASGPTLAIMAMTPMLNLIDMLYSFVFIALKRIWAYLAVMATSTVATLVSSLILVPSLGHNGAGLSWLISGAVSVIVANRILSRALGGRLLWHVIFWPLVCLAVATGVALLVPNQWARAAVGLVVFGACAWVLRNRLGIDWHALRALTFREQHAVKHDEGVGAVAIPPGADLG